MTTRRSMFVLAAAVPLAACATASGVAGTAALDTEKALYVAELAYSGFASSVIAAHPTGSTLATLKSIDAKAYSALTLARKGVGAAQAVLDALAGASGLMPVAATVADFRLGLPYPDHIQEAVPQFEFFPLSSGGGR